MVSLRKKGGGTGGGFHLRVCGLQLCIISFVFMWEGGGGVKHVSSILDDWLSETIIPCIFHRRAAFWMF